ncbi:histidine phosphatase family protein [Aldersonia sp. NBC_00410]|uniref:histidine phosphatase family protein n=1 Tax=Aldersonia sp. NBC_00410 TaxID=2975954 RepID=UPI002250BEE6|nr:histidine phosphatase family protein [Aldersonia sp. NBC_00410]MCX5042294.1 histidine phosphatase family protein [Aldersonia sp. NBC_00410]
MSGKLILVRHGETEANVARRLDTRLPGAALTPKGAQQARTVGSVLAAMPPLALVSSQALRARQTATHIESVTGVSAQAVDGLHEVQVGELEDRDDEPSHELFKDVYHRWHTGELGARTPGGETGYEVLDRYLPILGDLRAKYLDVPSDDAGAAPSRDLVVVSHGAVIRLAAARLLELPSGFASKNHLDNTERIELVPVVGGGWTCVRWGRFEPPFESADVSPLPDDPMG